MKYFPSIVQVKFLYWIACVSGQYFCTPDSVWGCKYSQLCSCLIRHSCTNGLSDSIRTDRTSRTYSQCPLFLQAARLLQSTRTLTKPYSGCFKDSQRQTVWDGGNASRKTWHFSSCAYTTFYEQNILTQKRMKEWSQSKQHWRSLILGKCRSFLGTGQTLPFAFWGEGDGKEVTIMTCISLLAPLS